MASQTDFGFDELAQNLEITIDFVVFSNVFCYYLPPSPHMYYRVFLF